MATGAMGEGMMAGAMNHLRGRPVRSWMAVFSSCWLGSPPFAWFCVDSHHTRGRRRAVPLFALTFCKLIDSVAHVQKDLDSGLFA
jgi:hypothetical protein